MNDNISDNPKNITLNIVTTIATATPKANLSIIPKNFLIISQLYLNTLTYHQQLNREDFSNS